MNVVVDTNVIISGLLNPFDSPAEIIRLFLSDRIKLLYDARLLAEYDEVLHRPKFKFDAKNIKLIINEIKISGIPVTSVPLRTSLPDVSDNMFLEVAKSGNGDCIITGNMSHFPKDICGDIPVFSPAEFLEQFRKHL